MKKIISLTEANVIKLVNKVIAELSPSIKNRSALAANKYKDETGSFAARRRSQKDSFLEMPNHLTIMADNIAKKMEQYFDGLTLMKRYETGYHRNLPITVHSVESSLKKHVEFDSNIAILLEYTIKFKADSINSSSEGMTTRERDINYNAISTLKVHQYYVRNEDGDIVETEESFIDTLKSKFFIGSDNQSIQLSDENNGITPRDITQMLIRLHKKLNAEAAI
jgi:hypothetical protein